MIERGNRYRTLGLLGGMGPGATADVLTKIISVTPAARDQDHVPVLVHCVPQIPDRTAALLGRGPSPEAALIDGALALRRAGADFMAIACNTAHHWYEAVRHAADRPVIHIADAVVAEIQASGKAGPVGLLATAGTIQSGFYQRALRAEGLVPCTPDQAIQHSIVDTAIAAAKAGRWPEARRLIGRAIEKLGSDGSRILILACTELPLVVRDRDCDGMLIVDANLALARACVAAARGGNDHGMGMTPDETAELL